jgi:hypothetical protein
MSATVRPARATRRAALCLALAALPVACGEQRGDAGNAADTVVTALPPVPLPDSAALTAILGSNYELLGLQWTLGDSLALRSWYADSTELWLSGLGSYWSPAAIASDFTPLGRQLGVTAVTRTSEGFTIDSAARTVVDSGRYVIDGLSGSGPRPDAAGRYRSTWRITADGAFQLTEDLLLGEGRPAPPRDERPTRPTGG